VIKTSLPYTAWDGKVSDNNIQSLNDSELHNYYMNRYSDADRKAEPSSVLNVDRDKVHVLYGGTKVVRARNGRFKTGRNNSTDIDNDSRYAVCIAIRTSFSTAKGELVRSILYPRPTKFKFYEDSFKFIGVLALIALVGFVVNAVIQAIYGEEVFYIILKAGDLSFFFFF
jgi:magnesium-transporting ATPase (P-type)